MAAKPSKQQVAQAKARAGGNNPIKVTKAGVKRLGKAALIAASLTPVGRGVKVVKTLSTAKKAATASTKARATQGAKIDLQQKATIASKAKTSALEKQIKEIETRMKANSTRAAELAKVKKAPGAPDRTSGLLDANKKLSTDLKKIRQSYYDLKTNW